ncbi:MAG: UDP-3-O-(3-hydroxymyristoyl)glucosamine N-acyltransferase [Vicinamibacterales bacterium]
MKLQDLAERLQCRLESEAGGGDVEIRRVAGIEQAAPGDLTFVANPKYYGQLATTGASAAIVGDGMPDGVRPPATCALLRAADPYSVWARAIALLTAPVAPPRGVDRLAAIAPDVALGADVSIGPFAVVESGASIGARTVVHPHVVIGRGARVGEDCVLHAHVSIREQVVVGHRVIVQNGAVIGSDGFGFAKQPDGTHLKIPQHADVVIEDDVEIGANTTIDRPAVGETRIRAGAKIDNLVQIAHGVTIGHRVVLASQVGIAGSTVVEDDVVMAGQVGVGGHLRVGRGVVAAGKTGITKSVEPGEFITGYPGIPNREWRKASVVFRHLPALKKRIEELERHVAELMEKLAEWRTPTGR